MASSKPNTDQTKEDVSQKPQSLEEQKQKALEQFDKIKEKLKLKVIRAMKKLKAKSYREKMFEWSYDNATTALAQSIEKKATGFKNTANVILSEKELSDQTISQVINLTNEMALGLKTDTDNIIALLNVMSGPQHKITKEGLANLELYISTVDFMMESPSMKSLVDIFAQLTVMQDLNEETYKVLEESMMSLNKEKVILVSTILRLCKLSVKEEFTKKFIDRNPQNSLQALLFANHFGTYSAFEMKEYFEYAETTYETKPEEKYQEAKKRFSQKIESFDTDSREYQTAFMVQQKVQERVGGLERGVYGEDASSRLRPGAILRLIGKTVAWTSLGGNLLANRPKFAETFKEKGLGATVLEYGKMPYVIGAGAILFGLNAEESKDPLGSGRSKAERKNLETMLGLKRFNDLVEMDSRWGVFVKNKGVDALVAYSKQLKTADGIQKEPTIRGFEAFLAEREKNMAPNTKPSRYLRNVFTWRFENEETENLKMYLALLEQNNLQSQLEFNEKLHEARQNI